MASHLDMMDWESAAPQSQPQQQQASLLGTFTGYAYTAFNSIRKFANPFAQTPSPISDSAWRTALAHEQPNHITSHSDLTSNPFSNDVDNTSSSQQLHQQPPSAAQSPTPRLVEQQVQLFENTPEGPWEYLIRPSDPKKYKIPFGLPHIRPYIKQQERARLQAEDDRKRGIKRSIAHVTFTNPFINRDSPRKKRCAFPNPFAEQQCRSLYPTQTPHIEKSIYDLERKKFAYQRKEEEQEFRDEFALANGIQRKHVKFNTPANEIREFTPQPWQFIDNHDIFPNVDSPDDEDDSMLSPPQRLLYVESDERSDTSAEDEGLENEIQYDITNDTKADEPTAADKVDAVAVHAELDQSLKANIKLADELAEMKQAIVDQMQAGETPGTPLKKVNQMIKENNEELNMILEELEALAHYIDLMEGKNSDYNVQEDDRISPALKEQLKKQEMMEVTPLKDVTNRVKDDEKEPTLDPKTPSKIPKLSPSKIPKPSPTKAPNLSPSKIPQPKKKAPLTPKLIRDIEAITLTDKDSPTPKSNRHDSARAQTLSKVQQRKLASLTEADYYRIQSLTDEWDEKVRMAVKTGAGDYTASDLGRVVPEYTKLGRGDNWLNDEVINGYLTLVATHGKRNDKEGQVPSHHAFNSFFYKNLSTKGPDSVARWAKRAKIGGKALLETEKVFIPINPGAHWTLAVLESKKKHITVYNSMGTSGNEVVARNVLKWVAQELGSAFTGETDWVLDARRASPQQMNCDDCGVFTLTNARQVVVGGYPGFGHMDIPDMRKRIVAELIAGGLLRRKPGDDFEAV